MTVPDGNVQEVLDWVGDDPDRAQEALDAEREGQQRSTLMTKLEALSGQDDSTSSDVDTGADAEGGGSAYGTAGGVDTGTGGTGGIGTDTESFATDDEDTTTGAGPYQQAEPTEQTDATRAGAPGGARGDDDDRRESTSTLTGDFGTGGTSVEDTDSEADAEEIGEAPGPEQPREVVVDVAGRGTAVHELHVRDRDVEVPESDIIAYDPDGDDEQPVDAEQAEYMQAVGDASGLVLSVNGRAYAFGPQFAAALKQAVDKVVAGLSL